MCDTLGRLTAGGGFFAKNSDRSPNEVQVLEFHPAQENLSGDVHCTYLTIPQAEKTYAVLLSRPDWMWGAEMGINEWGLCIGNEAVFTKGAYGRTGLTGMDMVRLALERSKTAKEALDLLISLLETYGQGGNCGYDHDFYYDNAFLVMDRQTLYVLETAGKKWVWKSFGAANISNRLSIGADGDACSEGEAYDFCKVHLEPVYSTFSGSANRSCQMNSYLNKADSLQSCMEALCQHDEKCRNPFATGSVSSPCMHFGGLVGDHTTSSMVVSLDAETPVIWLTGSSCPCVSLFKPWRFGSEAVLPVITPNSKEGRRYWLTAEQFRRNLLGKKLPPEFYTQREEIQNRWIAQAAETAPEDFPAFSRACLEEERAFYESWSRVPLPTLRCAMGFRSRWEKKNAILFPGENTDC